MSLHQIQGLNLKNHIRSKIQ